MNNIDKIMQYVQLVQKEPTIINDTVYDGNVKRIQLGAKFFMKDRCLSCGTCDVREANVYTEYEMQKIKDYKDKWAEERKSTCAYFNIPEDECPLLTEDEYDQFIKDCKPEEIFVNHERRVIYIHPLRPQKVKLSTKDKITEQCTWTNELKSKPGTFVCKIHPVVSITCVMPHLVIRRSSSGTVRISTMQFGRNWAMHCPVCFRDPIDSKEFEEIKMSKIGKLQHLQKCTESLGIETYLDEIIKYILDIPYLDYGSYLEKDIISKSDAVSKKKKSWLQEAIEEDGI